MLHHVELRRGRLEEPSFRDASRLGYDALVDAHALFAPPSGVHRVLGLDAGLEARRFDLSSDAHDVRIFRRKSSRW